MPNKMFLKLEEALELFSSLNLDERSVEFFVLAEYVRELTDEDEGEEKGVHIESNARNDTPLGTRVAMKLTENFGNPSSYTLYFDNIFTSIQFLKSHGEQFFQATGAIQEKKTDKPRMYPLEESKSAEKKKDRRLILH
ncbi:hypothetical protein TNCV_53861 [Trichonephila clavipes]|nr:hypothetical protein TNCV_53861 [Trichonephila clavipes]